MKHILQLTNAKTILTKDILGKNSKQKIDILYIMCVTAITVFDQKKKIVKGDISKKQNNYRNKYNSVEKKTPIEDILMENWV